MENKVEELEKTAEDANRRLLNVEVALGSITTLSFLIIFCMSFYAIVKLNLIALPVIFMVIAFAILVVGISTCIVIEQKAGYYECDKCHEKYVPTFKQVLFAPHINRTRYMKCPHCQKKSWNKKVIK